MLSTRDRSGAQEAWAITGERIDAEEVGRVRSAVHDTGVGRDAAAGARVLDLHFTTEEWGSGASFEVVLPRRQR